MHALSCVLAVSLALGPTASVGHLAPEPVEPALPDPALPDVGDEPAAADVPEPEPEPAPEPADADAPAPADEGEGERAAEPLTTDIAPQPDPAPSPARRDRLGCDGSKSCRNMSIAGIVVGSLGVIGAATGIALLVKPDEVVDAQPIYITTTKPPGLVSVTICTGLALTSVLMLVAAHKGYKQQPAVAGRKRPRAHVHGLGLRF